MIDRETANRHLTAFFDLQIPYDVLMLGYNIQTSEPFNDIVCRATNVQSATAYLVHSRFYDRLIQTFEDTIPLLISTGKHWLYTNDQSWKPLQPVSQWFCMNVRFGKNRPGYSDLAQRFMDYIHY
jgi:hypothetical protein